MAVNDSFQGVSRSTHTYALLRAFVNELARCGVRAACTSPGSRNAPLVLSLAGESDISCFSHIDERCAGFFALGLAKASGVPVAVTCTSGTAAAELAPAVIEAYQAGVPLLVLTADRPPELRESGAGQTIDQLKLYGDAVKWFFEVDPARADDEKAADEPPSAALESRLRWIRTLACRAYWRALEGRPGPVHLNFPLREPLMLDGLLPGDATGRAAGEPYLRRPLGSPGGGDARKVLDRALSAARRGLVVAGRYERGPAALSAQGGAHATAGAAAAAFCASRGWPLLADPLSGARRGPAAIAHYDAILRAAASGKQDAAMTPDLVVRVGDLPTSKPLRDWLGSLPGVPQLALDPESVWQDPAAVLTASLALDPADTLGGLAAEPAPLRAGDADWLARWRSADELAGEAMLGVLAEHGASEPIVARELGVLLPESATLFVASSMPVRDIESFWPAREDPPRVLCNRGANGIDGTVSSAFGVCAHQAQQQANGPVVLLIGDVALAHDIGALIAARRLDLALTLVLVNNGGGGIFEFLPVARNSLARGADDVYTRHVATPTGIDFGAAAALYGVSHELVADVPGFRAALERAFAAAGSSIIEVATERESNRTIHEAVWQASKAAIAPA